jgi:hypothetical protein
VERAPWLSGESDLILKTLAAEANYRLPRRILIASKMRQTYFIVTFNTVVKPVFTVALVLTLAKPGAATVTV